MLRKISAGILILLSFTFNSYSQYSRGCLVEPRDTSLVLKKNYSRDITSLPSSYSLKSFTPEPLSQGSLGSCTAWSSAYAGFTIVKRLEENNPDAEPFSPLHLYNRLKTQSSENPCNGTGAYVSDALNMLKTKGCLKYSEIANACAYLNATNTFKNKLYNFSEIEVKTNSIKASLVKNAPVVFAIKYFQDGWDDSKNLKEGVWNGVYGAEDGYHAMCIIGYDDSKGTNGAFLVQNSWGNTWGDKGFFWLQYKDLKHVDQAFMLQGDPEKLKQTNFNGSGNNSNANNQNNTNNSNNQQQNEDQETVNDQVFRVYNQCSVTAYVALCTYENGAWVSKGWYAASPNKSIDLPIGSRETDNFYWMALNKASNITWYDAQNGTDICYNPSDKFTIYDNKTPNCPEYTKFYKQSPGFDNTIVTQTLSCPRVISKGGSDVVRLNSTTNALQTNDEDIVNENLNWKKGHILLDLFTGELITSTGTGTYHVWCVDPQNNIIERSINESELETLAMYKFRSKENAERWIDARKLKFLFGN